MNLGGNKPDSSRNNHDVRPVSGHVWQIDLCGKYACVTERIVYEQLYANLEEHDILGKHQLGFRAIHSSVTALLEATDFWAYNTDIGKINAAIFLDLKKAHDTADNEVLLSKLDFYGISGNLLKWLVGPYLTAVY